MVAWFRVSVKSGCPFAVEVANPGAVVAPLRERRAVSPSDPFTQCFCRTTLGQVLGTPSWSGWTQSMRFEVSVVDALVRTFKVPKLPLQLPGPNSAVRLTAASPNSPAGIVPPVRVWMSLLLTRPTAAPVTDRGTHAEPFQVQAAARVIEVLPDLSKPSSRSPTVRQGLGAPRLPLGQDASPFGFWFSSTWRLVVPMLFCSSKPK